MTGTKRGEGRDEAILDPDLSIVDAHHHLIDLPSNRYMAEDLLADAQAGHDVVATIYCETKAFSRQSGPEPLRPLGEVEFANGVGAVHASGRYGPSRLCAGIIGHADLTVGAAIGDLLDRCQAAAPDRFRGVRQVTLDFPDERPFRYVMTNRPPSGLLEHPGFAAGLAEVQARGLVFDAAIFHPSLPRIAAFADRFPGLTIVLDNLGTAIGIDEDETQRTETFAIWRTNLRELARRSNVRCKVAGLGMPMWGFRFEEKQRPIGYSELAAAWRPYVETAIDLFGADRCMMASNFPPDGRSCGYVPLWNALKSLTQGLNREARERLFAGTAVETYALDLTL